MNDSGQILSPVQLETLIEAMDGAQLPLRVGRIDQPETGGFTGELRMAAEMPSVRFSCEADEDGGFELVWLKGGKKI